MQFCINYANGNFRTQLLLIIEMRIPNVNQPNNNKIRIKVSTVKAQLTAKTKILRYC